MLRALIVAPAWIGDTVMAQPLFMRLHERTPGLQLDALMRKLAESVQRSLRSGDVFSRYSAAQYVVLLPQANYENSKMVMERIIRSYKLDHSHSPAKLDYSIQEIDKDN